MPPTSCSFTCTSAPAEARELVAPLVAREPIWLSVVASTIEALATDPSRCASPRWWVGRDLWGRAVAALMHTPPHPLHVGYATDHQARALARLLLAQGDSLPGVGGMRGPAEAFAAVWTAVRGGSARTATDLGVHVLPARPRLRFEVAGRYRRATLDDLDLTDRWAADFHAAVGTPGAPASTRPAIEAGRLGLWLDDWDAPVSMAYASVAGAGVTRVSGVWTPPARRGRGYASAVVAALSDERMNDGETCLLYTDLANPTSNGIYRALGYRRVGDGVILVFE
ncbi:GNAT family N-acetyltransferase [Intrasporangium sp.]|uniref:GNAT family N-acetyltransferase n=1 Tax=Intrasporangium sp. TaxID=1925024 RepID=UPI0032213C5A